MNAIILKSYVGPDIHGQQVSGIILHVAHRAKGTQLPVDYVLQCYHEGRSSGTAIVSAEAVRAHLEGLALVASMEADEN